MPCSRSRAFLGLVLCACLSPDLAAAESFIIVNGDTFNPTQYLDTVGDTGLVEEAVRSTLQAKLSIRLTSM